jgi:hypothetical protein
MAKGKTIVRIVLLACSLLAVGLSRARGGDCATGTATHPHGNPWGGSFNCNGDCTSGDCEETVTNPSPGVFLVFCSCDGVNPQPCCHLVAKADTGAGSVTFKGEGTCGGASCPTGNECEARHFLVGGDEGVTDLWVPSCL